MKTSADITSVGAGMSMARVGISGESSARSLISSIGGRVAMTTKVDTPATMEEAYDVLNGLKKGFSANQAPGLHKFLMPQGNFMDVSV